MLLGFIVSERGIEANPEKVSAITNMGPIKDVKGVQRVMGCLVALSHFISRLGAKGMPLYHPLRKTERFAWTPEAKKPSRTSRNFSPMPPSWYPLPNGAPFTLHSCNHPGGQRLYRGREKGGWTCLAGLEACVLCQRGNVRDKGTLPISLEDVVCGSPNLEKIVPLFRVSFCNDGVVLPSEGDHPE
jgi:hypothetical protein